MCWHSRLKTSDHADLGSNRPSLCVFRSWMHGRSYFTVTLLRERGPSLRDPYARVRGLCVTTYPMFRGAHRVSRKRGRVPIGGTLASTSEQIKSFTILAFASRVVTFVFEEKKKHPSCNSKVSRLSTFVSYSNIDVRSRNDVPVFLLFLHHPIFFKFLATARLKRLLIDRYMK